MTHRFIFNPVAQNTIIRPLAQAVCIARGGEPVKYIDTADHQEKEINLDNLSFTTLETQVNGRKFCMDGEQVAFWVRHKGPINLRVNINDIAVNISADTTVDQAMSQYQMKFARHWRLHAAKSRESE